MKIPVFSGFKNDDEYNKKETKNYFMSYIDKWYNRIIEKEPSEYEYITGGLVFNNTIGNLVRAVINIYQHSLTMGNYQLKSYNINLKTGENILLTTFLKKYTDLNINSLDRKMKNKILEVKEKFNFTNKTK